LLREVVAPELAGAYPQFAASVFGIAPAARHCGSREAAVRNP
jgi:hypothetical protein